MVRAERWDGGAEGHTEVVLAMPGGGAYFAEERLHPVGVVEDFAVEVPRVPVDEDAADVEDNGIDRSRLHRLATFINSALLPGLWASALQDAGAPCPYRPTNKLSR